MRCYSCNCILSTQESVRRFKGSGAFTELCNGCLGTISDEVETTDGKFQEEENRNEDFPEN